MLKEKVTFVTCNTRFIAFHRWKDAPTKYNHLGIPHRHEFHVTVSVAVKHDDRDVEFQELRKYVDEFIGINYWPYKSSVTFMDESCEMIAENIARHLDSSGYKVCAVEVSEDGENGATKVYE